MSREVTLKLPQRKGVYEDAVNDVIERVGYKLASDDLDALRELREALQRS